MAIMPWKETDSMKERVKFVLEWERRWKEGAGRLNVAELCREFGIGRQVGAAERSSGAFSSNAQG